MTNKELKKLSRADLLEMLIAQSKEVASLKERLDQAEEQLKDRRILIDNAGSIAEASLQLNGVFEAAQNAATQYQENMRRQVDGYADRARQSCEQAEKLLSDTKLRCSNMEANTQKKCERMVKNAQLQAQKYLDNASEKILKMAKAKAKARLKEFPEAAALDGNKEKP